MNIQKPLLNYLLTMAGILNNGGSIAKILVVDDERSIRLTLSEFLKREGYEAETAENADVAVDMLSKTE